MSDLFQCPYCEYSGSEGWMHIRENHHSLIYEFLDAQKKVLREEEEAPDTMNVITRRLEFDAGHRVYMHESKCNNIHGHRYVVEISCTGSLDELGRVIDFSVIKSVVGTWIDDHLDHGMILFKDDPLAPYWKSGFALYGRQDEMFEQHKHFIMDSNPTAENIAQMLFKKAAELLSNHGISITEVVVHETPNCRAAYRR